MTNREWADKVKIGDWVIISAPFRRYDASQVTKITNRYLWVGRERFSKKTCILHGDKRFGSNATVLFRYNSENKQWLQQGKINEQNRSTS